MTIILDRTMEQVENWIDMAIPTITRRQIGVVASPWTPYLTWELALKNLTTGLAIDLRRW
jgi:hypothetical protein